MKVFVQVKCKMNLLPDAGHSTGVEYAPTEKRKVWLASTAACYELSVKERASSEIASFSVGEFVPFLLYDHARKWMNLDGHDAMQEFSNERMFFFFCPAEILIKTIPFGVASKKSLRVKFINPTSLKDTFPAALKSLPLSNTTTVASKNREVGFVIYPALVQICLKHRKQLSVTIHRMDALRQPFNKYKRTVDFEHTSALRSNPER